MMLAGCSEEPQKVVETESAEPSVEVKGFEIDFENKAHTLALTKWCSENQFSSELFLKKHDRIVDEIVGTPELVEIEVQAKTVYDRLTDVNKKDCANLK